MNLHLAHDIRGEAEMDPMRRPHHLQPHPRGFFYLRKLAVSQSPIWGTSSMKDSNWTRHCYTITPTCHASRLKWNKRTVHTRVGPLHQEQVVRQSFVCDATSSPRWDSCHRNGWVKHAMCITSAPSPVAEPQPANHKEAEGFTTCFHYLLTPTTDLPCWAHDCQRLSTVIIRFW